MLVDFKLLGKLVGGFCLITALMSCSYFRGEQSLIQNRDTDYLKAKSIPALKIPAGIDSSTIQSHYPVAETGYTPPTKVVELTPPELSATESSSFAWFGSSTKKTPESKKPLARPARIPSKPKKLKKVFTVPNYYFDTHTRGGWTPGERVAPPWPWAETEEDTKPSKEIKATAPEKNAAPAAPAAQDESSDNDEEKVDSNYYTDSFSHR